MLYESTRGNAEPQSAAQAIMQGMVPGGGLFVPQAFPGADWPAWLELGYADLAEKIFALYLTDFVPDVLCTATRIYEDGRFGSVNPAPLHNLKTEDDGGLGVLELWHGPTAAFKDMALQMLPRLLTAALENSGRRERVLILTATSGDTGKAALEGFKDVSGTKIVVFYPAAGVSLVQERQMLTTAGSNTHVAAVQGNFDECQSAVKEAFLSEGLREAAARQETFFSSANSINWGRLLPQIVYYAWTYLQAVRQEHVKAGEEINVVVPTGNFGNILAASYARRMGLPLGKLICASNQNNVLSDFFSNGVYQINRPFHLTMSPSMDILISSNFERYLYEVSGRDGKRVAAWFDELARTGQFKAGADIAAQLDEEIWAGWCGEEATLASIRQVFAQHRYVLDPHTAVGHKVYQDYRQAVPEDRRYTVLVSTASPFKFGRSVLAALDPGFTEEDEYSALKHLSQLSGWEIPANLQDIFSAADKAKFVCSVAEIPDFIRSVL